MEMEEPSLTIHCLRMPSVLVYIEILYDTADTDGEHYRASRIRNRLTELMEYCSNLFWRWSVFCFFFIFLFAGMRICSKEFAEMQKDGYL